MNFTVQPDEMELKEKHWLNYQENIQCACICLPVFIFPHLYYAPGQHLVCADTRSLLKIKMKQTCQCFLPDTLYACLSETGWSLNELPVELPEGEFGSAWPGDLTYRQMIAALFSPTPLFEKSSGFSRKCPCCFDTVAWIPSPPGLAYGHSMSILKWIIFTFSKPSAKNVFPSMSQSLPPSLRLFTFL